jgi:flagellar biosynthesis protein FlhG
MDQADRLRDLVGERETRARVLAVTSGKGGVGKTNVAVNLALTLVDHGKRVVLVDVDIGLANADVLLSVEPRVHLGHVLSGEVSARDAVTMTPSGLSLLSGCSGVRHLSDLDDTERTFLVRSFQELEAYADFILFDTGAGISKNVVRFSAAADEVVVVTAPEPTAITDGYAAIKAISREKGFGRIRLVVNMAGDPQEAQRVSERVQTVARRFLGIDVDYLGHVVQDAHVPMAVRRRRPLLREYPYTPASVCIRDLGQRLLGEDVPKRTRGFFKRFASALHGILS